MARRNNQRTIIPEPRRRWSYRERSLIFVLPLSSVPVTFGACLAPKIKYRCNVAIVKVGHLDPTRTATIRLSGSGFLNSRGRKEQPVMPERKFCKLPERCFDRFDAGWVINKTFYVLELNKKDVATVWTWNLRRI